VSAIEERIETAERLAAASTVAEAERAVEAAGGLAAVRSLRARLAADRETLDALARRCERLRERADDADVPVETLARVT
jgi:cell division protein FtsB